MAEEGKKKEIESKNGLLETMMFIREFAEYINENTPNTAISVIEYIIWLTLLIVITPSTE